MIKSTDVRMILLMCLLIAPSLSVIAQPEKNLKLAFEGLTKEDVSKALDGNADIAFSIAGRFSRAERWREAEYWYQIAAENGDREAMRRLALLLENRGNARAAYWLRRSVADPRMCQRDRKSGS